MTITLQAHPKSGSCWWGLCIPETQTAWWEYNSWQTQPNQAGQRIGIRLN